MRSSGADSTDRSRVPPTCWSPSSRGARGQQRRLHQGEHHDQHDHDVEELVAPGVPAVRGIVVSTIGTAPRSPDQDRKACSRQGSRNGPSDDEHRQRPGDQQQGPHR